MVLEIMLACCSIPLVLLAILGLGESGRPILIIASLLHLLLGVVVYFVRGGTRLTLTGLYALASGVFLGLPPLWALLTGYRSLYDIDVLASALAFSSLSTVVFVTRIGKRDFERWPRQRQLEVPIASSRFLANLLFCAAITFLVAVSLTRVGIRSASPGIYTSAIISMLVALVALKQQRLDLFGLAVAMTFLFSGWYVNEYFRGFGRLRVVGLGVSLLFLSTCVFHRGWMKIVPFYVAPFFVLITSRIRRGPGLSLMQILTDPASGDVSSMLSPYFTFRDLLLQFGTMGTGDTFQWGRTFLTSVLFWVPRSLWPNKPLGLGSQYTAWFRPELLATGHSYAGSYLGELYVNFGYVGVVIGPILVGLILRKMDRAISNMRLNSGNVVRDYGLLLLVTTLSSGLLDYVWADTFTFAARAGGRVLFLLPIAAFLVFGKVLSSAQSSRMPHAQWKGPI